MSKQTAEDIEEMVDEWWDKLNQGTPFKYADEMDFNIEHMAEFAESYHTKKLKELEDELGERVIFYNEKYQKLTREDKHTSAAGAWHRAQGIKEVLQLITKAKE